MGQDGRQKKQGTFCLSSFTFCCNMFQSSRRVLLLYPQIAMHPPVCSLASPLVAGGEVGEVGTLHPIRIDLFSGGRGTPPAQDRSLLSSQDALMIAPHSLPNY